MCNSLYLGANQEAIKSLWGGAVEENYGWHASEGRLFWHGCWFEGTHSGKNNDDDNDNRDNDHNHDNHANY